ncbi:hypothetical protein ISN45_At05g046050, partial [Arabidopsis thaliana x Arabidopsis arenosa]
MSASSFPRSVTLTARSDTKGKSVFSRLTDWQNEEKFHHGFFFFFFFFLIIQLIIISSGPLLSLSFRLSLPKFLSIDSQKQKKIPIPSNCIIDRAPTRRFEIVDHYRSEDSKFPV